MAIFDGTSNMPEMTSREHQQNLSLHCQAAEIKTQILSRVL